MGRTTLEIDEELLEAAMQVSGAKTKTEAIEMALHELIRGHERSLLREELGTYEFDLSPEDLHRLRRAG